MNLKQIRLKNFKCFKDSTYNLSKINLITGANSSGKSSLLFALLGALQSREFPENFSPNGKYIRMGDFSDIVFGHNKESEIHLGYSFESSSVDSHRRVFSFDSIWDLNASRNLPKLRFINFESNDKKIIIDKTGRRTKYEVTYERKDSDSEGFKWFQDEEFIKSFMNNITKLVNNSTSDESQQDRVEKYINEFSKVKRIINFKVGNIDYLDNLDNIIKQRGDFDSYFYFRKLFSIFDQFDDSLNYISSFRHFPERTYYETSKIDLKIGRSGENYVDQVLLWKSTNSDNFHRLVESLRKLQLVFNIIPNNLDGARYELQVVTKKGGVKSSLNDVGFGISQFLPIIVADIQIPDDGTLIVAQPEIHLHPSIQANFANYLCDQVIEKPDRQYVIETHSEYIINRIRLLIVEGLIEEDDVNLVYVQNDGKQSKLVDIKLKKDGSIENAPKEFFETYMMDVMDISLKA